MGMIVCDEEEKAMSGNVYIQNIETINGMASPQSSRVINAYNTINDINSMITLIDRLLASLSKIPRVDSEEIENVKDYLEIIQE